MAKRSPENAATRGLVLDAGAFIGVESSRGTVLALLELCARAKTPFVTSAGIVSQFWRGGHGRQTPIARLLDITEVRPIDTKAAKLIGLILGRTRTRDPVDAHVVLLAIELGWPVLSSDHDDLVRLHHGLVIFDA